MTTFTLRGLRIQFDMYDDPVGISESTLVLVYPNSSAEFRYNILATYSGELPEVTLTSEEPTEARIDGSLIYPDSTLTFGRLTTSQGTHYILGLYDPLTGREGLYQVGGDPLVLPTTLSQFAALEASISYIGAASGAWGPGNAIAVASFLNVEIEDGGGEEPNLIVGTGGDDELVGTPGDDRIVTGDATPYGDFVVGSSGNDIIDMSEHNTLTAFAGIGYSALSGPIAASINGVTNTGTINKGSSGVDTLIGVANSMTAGYYEGGFYLQGTHYADTFSVRLSATQWMAIDAGPGIDSYELNGEGRVRLNFRGTQATVVNLQTRVISNDSYGNTEIISGINGNIEIVGGLGNDTITGSAADESYRHVMGSNTLNMGGGFDRVRYDHEMVRGVTGSLITGEFRVVHESGPVTIDRLTGVEAIRGSNADDNVTGDDGANRLEGRHGNDTLYGMGGNDTLRGDQGNDFIGGGAGQDLINGGSGNDTLYGGEGNDTLYGDDGADILYGAAGRNALYGGAGKDTIYGANAGDLIGGGEGDDLIRGGAAADTIYGGEGNDDLAGGAGNDLIYGQTGANIIYAGVGNDTVFGGDGVDTIYGGTGRSELYGNAGNDIIYASGQGDFIGAGAGNDSVYGGAGNDTIYAGAGNDFIGGGAGNDVIFASAGNNRIYGGLGNDTIHAAVGKDVMTGSTGVDHFVFASAAAIGIGTARDVITDFTRGEDKIDLRVLNTAFNGAAGFTGAASFYYLAASGLLIGDQNGDRVADWVIEFEAKPASLLASDFLL